MKVAVIGGGISGLVAAHEVVRAGHQAVLIEPSQCGGMIRSREWQGFTLEAGPNVLVERPDITRLLGELNLTSEIRYPSVNPYGQFVWWRGRPQKVPAGLKELICSPLISARVKALLPFKLLIPGLLKSPREDASVLSFFSPLIGEQATKDILDPVLKGIYGGDIGSLSARSLFPGLWSAASAGLSLMGYMRRRPRGGKPAIMVVKGGLQRITSELSRRIADSVETIPCRVERLERRGGNGFRVLCSDGASIEVDGCVATPAGEPLAKMLEPIEPALSTLLREQTYASLTVAHLAVPRHAPLLRDAFGVLFPGGMPEDLLGVMFNSLIFPHVAPPDKHIVTVVLGGAQAGDKVIADEVLRGRVPQLVEQLLGLPPSEWIGATRWSRAIPQLKVGHFRVVAELDRAESQHPGLVFAGVDRGGVGVSDRVRMARESVERLCQSFREREN